MLPVNKLIFLKKFVHHKNTQRVLFVFYVFLFIGLFFSHIYQHSLIQAITQKKVTCSNFDKEIAVNFSSLGFDIKTIKAKVCNQLTITNRDNKPHKIAFGSHDHHFPYPGFEEKVLLPDEKISIMLTLSGEYEIHDHLNEDLQAKLIIEAI